VKSSTAMGAGVIAVVTAFTVAVAQAAAEWLAQPLLILLIPVLAQLGYFAVLNRIGQSLFKTAAEHAATYDEQVAAMHAKIHEQQAQIVELEDLADLATRPRAVIDLAAPEHGAPFGLELVALWQMPSACAELGALEADA